jgi:hypothetical protein
MPNRDGHADEATLRRREDLNAATLAWTERREFRNPKAQPG